MKVMFFSIRLFGGGTERVISVLSRQFVKKGLLVSVATIEEPSSEDYFLDSGVKRINFHVNKKSFFAINKEAKKILKIEKPDIVIVMGVPTCLFVSLPCLSLRIPFIVSERSSPKHSAAKKTTLFVSRFFMRFAKGYVFQTAQARDFYPKNIRKRSCIISNPLFLNAEEFPDWIGKGSNLIVSAGRLEKLKNHELLIKAFSNLLGTFPKLKLTIYGEGPNRGNLIQLVNELGLQKCVFLPGFSNSIIQKMSDAEIFAFTSNYEGMPNALIEALAVGMPTVSTDCPCGGPGALIKNNFNGILIPVGDQKALESAIKRILLDSSFADYLGSNAKQIRYSQSEEVISTQWCDYVEKVAENLHSKR